MKIRILLTVFLFSISVSAQNGDIDLLKKINGSYTPNGGKIMLFATNSDNPVSLGLPTGLLVTGLVTKNKKMVWNSAEMYSSAIFNGLITTGVKFAFRRDRPFVTYPNDIVKHTKAGSLSFPSGHTSMAFATATAISLEYPKWYIIAPAYLWASSVGYSRMYLGVHYPTDVLAGAIIGSATSLGTHYLFKYLKKKYTKDEVKI